MFFPSRDLWPRREGAGIGYLSNIKCLPPQTINPLSFRDGRVEKTHVWWGNNRCVFPLCPVLEGHLMGPCGKTVCVKETTLCLHSLLLSFNHLSTEKEVKTCVFPTHFFPTGPMAFVALGREVGRKYHLIRCCTSLPSTSRQSDRQLTAVPMNLHKIAF